MAGELRGRLNGLAQAAVQSAEAFLGERLRAAILYGSVARGTPNDASDIDLLLVVDGLPSGRGPRARLAEEIDLRCASGSRGAPFISFVLRTPGEMEQGFPLLLDITQDGRILFDPDGLARAQLDAWRQRLRQQGARRVWTGDTWHWDLAGRPNDGTWQV